MPDQRTLHTAVEAGAFFLVPLNFCVHQSIHPSFPFNARPRPASTDRRTIPTDASAIADRQCPGTRSGSRNCGCARTRGSTPPPGSRPGPGIGSSEGPRRRRRRRRRRRAAAAAAAAAAEGGSRPSRTVGNLCKHPAASAQCRHRASRRQHPPRRRHSRIAIGAACAPPTASESRARRAGSLPLPPSLLAKERLGDAARGVRGASAEEGERGARASAPRPGSASSVRRPAPIYTGSHTTALARWTPILKDFA